MKMFVWKAPALLAPLLRRLFVRNGNQKDRKK